jgi:hypothetical protein
MRIHSKLGKGTTVVVRLPVEAITLQRAEVTQTAA